MAAFSEGAVRADQYLADFSRVGRKKEREEIGMEEERAYRGKKMSYF